MLVSGASCWHHTKAVNEIRGRFRNIRRRCQVPTIAFTLNLRIHKDKLPTCVKCLEEVPKLEWIRQCNVASHPRQCNVKTILRNFVVAPHHMSPRSRGRQPHKTMDTSPLISVWSRRSFSSSPPLPAAVNTSYFLLLHLSKLATFG